MRNIRLHCLQRVSEDLNSSAYESPHQYNGYPVQRVPEQTNKKAVKYREASGNKPASDTAGALTSLSVCAEAESEHKHSDLAQVFAIHTSQ
jgi:hypothetical protein